MKSAYELAMERLERNAPTQKVTDAQKAELAEIDNLARARIAEKEVFLGDQIVKARVAGEWNEVQALEKQLTSERRRIQEDADAKKDRVRNNT